MPSRMQHGQSVCSRALGMLLFVLAVLSVAFPLDAQNLGSNCTATMLNHSVRLNADGTFNLPNVPFNYGLYRVHVVCTNPDGTTSGGVSAPVALTPNGSQDIDLINLGPLQPFPVTMTAQAAPPTLSAVGATSQIISTGQNPDGTLTDETTDAATTYWSSNSAIATVSSTGVVTAVSAGIAIITVRYDGLVATTSVNVSATLDSDGDGMPDEWEIANGLNPLDPSDALQDPDNDGLTNLQEYQAGTNPHVADTDGDGLSDGQEIKLGTNPLVADTDGDGLSDGQEVQLGTNPLVADTDGDGIPDGIEVKLGLNPLVADPTTVASGQIVGPDLKPAIGASATIFNYFTANTDATGTFTIRGVPTDLNGLVAQVLYVASGGTVYNGSSKSVAGVPNGTTDMGVIQLGQSSGVVQGVVTGPNGKAITGAQVTIAGGQVQLAASTDATGTYRVTNLPSGTIMAGALDPTTGLRGTAAGTLASGSPLTLNIALSGFGTVTGTVTEPDGHQVPAGVSVQLSGPTTLTTATNALGQYTFSFVPLGAFTIQVADTSGHQGTASGLVAVTSQTVIVNIQFAGSGTVSGMVQDKQGNAAPNAQISLVSNGGLPQSLNAQADSNGHYSFPGVIMGKFILSASVPQSRQGFTQVGGTAQGSIMQDGQAVTLNIVVDAAGSASGTVYENDGTTPASGVKVSIKNSAIVATTDTTGKYEVDFVTPGSQQLNVVDPNTGDQGAAAVAILANQLTNVPDIKLNGLGTAVVTVKDASGNIVPSTQLTLVSNTQFTQQLTGLTDSTGQFTFSGVLAGGVTVNASSQNNLAGTAQGTVPLNSSVNITVSLQPAGTIQGMVFMADGKTPVPSINVQLDSGQTVLTDGGGNYQFASVPSGDHLIQVVDGKGEPDSPAQTAAIATQGQVVTTNLTLIGLGTVTGNVTNLDGTPAIATAISIKSEAPGFVRTLSSQTDISGNYSIAQVPVGTVLVSAFGTGGIASATQQLPSDGSSITVNLQLSPNIVPTTHSFFDANGFLYDIDATGEVQSGTNSTFAGIGIPSTGRNDETLSFTASDGTVTAFAGNASATASQSGTEYAIEQDGIAGLNVIRRVFVPSAGYMARYIETLVNPTSAAITVDVNLHSGYRYTHETRNGYTYNGTPGVVGSSSGDATFNVTTTPATSDHWIIEGTDLDSDPFLDTDNVPAVAYVFDDGQSPLALTAGSFVTTSNHGEMSATYGHVTIPAGQTVELMHFVSQQTVRAAAQASAQRLIQLAPEALSGLSPSDASTITNFRVPLNLTSTLAALPALGGSVGGQVLAGDGITPVVQAVVSLHSTDPVYSRTYQANSASDGSYFFQGGATNGPGYVLSIPLETTSVSAVHPTSGITSPVYTVALSASNTPAVQPIVFSNTGQISGTVRLTPTQVVSSGTVTVTSPSLLSAPSVPINVDGTYSVTGLPPATYAITATVTGTILTGSAAVTVTSGQTATADVLIGANGSIQGQVLGADSAHTPVSNVTIYLRTAAGQSLSTVSSSGGNFAFNDLPAGTYSLQAYDPVSNTGTTLTVAVAAGATVTQNILLSGTAGINGTIIAPSGISVSGLQISLTVSTSTGPQSYTAVSTSAGTFSFANVALGSFTITVQGAQGYSGVTSGNLGIAGQNAAVSVTLTQAGTVTGTVYQADGRTPAAGIQVQVYGQIDPLHTGLVATLITDVNGVFTANQVPVGSFTVVAINTTTTDQGQAAGTIVVANQQVTVPVVLSGLGTLKISVLNNNSQPDSGASISVSAPFNRSYTATSDSQGNATISNVLAGSVQVSAEDPVTHLAATSSVTLAAGATQTVSLTLQASASVSGHVYAADGSTAANGAKLTLYGTGNLIFNNFSTTSKADGSYTFTGIPLGIFNLVVLDSNSVLRAYIPSVNLNTNGQLVNEDVTFTGVGTVQGTVTNPDGTAATGVGVQVISTSKLGGVFNVAADSSGNYKATGIPVGGFTVNAENLAQGIGGSVSGSITSDGDIEIANIQMVSNVVQLTQALTDANGFKFDIQRDGTIGTGVSYQYGSGGFWCACGPSDYSNAFHLALFLNGAENDFTGNSAGTGVTSLSGQQVAIEQDNLAGLNVVRHVYVPSTGYFARYVESLTNPTNSPITVDLQVSGGIQYPGTGNVLVATSTGSSTFSNADQWLVTDDDNGSNPWPLSEPSLSEIFAGPGAANAPSVASFTVPTSTNGLSYPALTYRWNTVTIAPGATVEFMHFAVQEALQGQATAAAQRLVQLPPEAFAGLTTSDASETANFAINPTLVSSLPAITPPTQGTVTGHVYGADGVSPVPSAEVIFQGSDTLFGSGHAIQADGSGAFTFQPAPEGNFTLKAIEPFLHLVSPVTSGQFTSGATSAAQDITYSNAATVKGTVVVPTETTYASATASLDQNNNTYQIWQANIGTLQNFVLPVVPIGSTASPAGSYSIVVQALAAGSNGNYLVASQPLNPNAGDVVSLTFNLPDTGTLTGLFLNSAGVGIPNTYIYLYNSAKTANIGYALTDATGKFTFTELPVGMYTLTGTDPSTSLVATINPVISASSTTTQNLQIASGGTVNLHVTLSDGTTVAPNALVTINRSTDQYSNYVTAGVTDANGNLTITSVPAGNFAIIAYYPGTPASTGSVQGYGSGNIPANGSTVSATVAFPATSILTGTVKSASGTVVANATVNFYYQGSAQYDGYVSTTTNANGVYTFSPVIGSQKIALSAQASGSQFSTQLTLNTAASGTLTQDITLPANVTLIVKAIDANGVPLSGRYIDVSGLGQNYYSNEVQTQGDGTATFTGLRDGGYGILLYSPGFSFDFAGSSTATVATTDDGKTVQATVQTGYTGTINGMALAADGVTPVPPGTYDAYLTDNDTKSQVAYVTSTDGTYSFPSITVGRDGYTLTVSPPQFGSGYGAPQVVVNGQFTADGQTQTLNATVAIPVVTGTIYQADGVTPTPNPNVYAAVPVYTYSNGNYTYMPVTYQGISSADGTYAVAVPSPASNASIVAEANGLTTQAQIDVNTGDITDTQDIILHASGTVNGTIKDEYGNPLPYNVTISVQSSGSSYTLFPLVNGDGTFSASYVATGQITVTADYLGTNCVTSATSNLVSNGDTASVQIVIQTSTCVYGGGGTSASFLMNFDHPRFSADAVSHAIRFRFTTLTSASMAKIALPFKATVDRTSDSASCLVAPIKRKQENHFDLRSALTEPFIPISRGSR